jgi:hypothetical protein
MQLDNFIIWSYSRPRDFHTKLVTIPHKPVILKYRLGAQILRMHNLPGDLQACL